MNTDRFTPVVPLDRSTIPGCVKARATVRRCSASAPPSTKAINCAAQRNLWKPPAATATERETSAGLAELLA